MSPAPKVSESLDLLIAKARFPRILRTRELKRMCPYITDEEFEMFQSQESILQADGVAGLGFFRDHVLGDSAREAQWRVTQGVHDDHSQDPQWLNIDYAFMLGGGAHLGDDKWVIIDLRYNNQDPRVIYNWYQHQDGVEHVPPERYQITWRELSPSLSVFIKRINKRSVWRDWFS